jgi:hypothetical protein
LKLIDATPGASALLGAALSALVVASLSRVSVLLSLIDGDPQKLICP